MSAHVSVISPLGPTSVTYTRTSFSDYLGTGPTLRRKCACGATITHKRQVASLLPLGVEGALERNAICKDSYTVIWKKVSSSMPALSAWSVAMIPASRIYGRRREGDSSLWGESASLPARLLIVQPFLYSFLVEKSGFGDPL